MVKEPALLSRGYNYGVENSYEELSELEVVRFGQSSLQVSELEQNFPDYDQNTARLRKLWPALPRVSNDLDARKHANSDRPFSEINRWENAYSIGCYSLVLAISDIDYLNPAAEWTLPTWLNGVHLANMSIAKRPFFVRFAAARRYKVPEAVYETAYARIEDETENVSRFLNERINNNKHIERDTK